MDSQAPKKTIARPKAPPGAVLPSHVDLHYPRVLPIVQRRRDIVTAIRENPVVIITGETGSGKSTQIPKMCLEAGRGRRGLVGCTQPRRVAAVTVAQRIAEELGEEPGGTVAYKIRFEERSGPATRIKMMTDGILLMEAQADPRLSRYDTIIVDEAHERSLNIDFVLGILKNLLLRRRDLRVIITSATIDAEKFSRFYGGAPIIEVSGRLFPVEVRWRPVDKALEEEGDLTYIDAAVRNVEELLFEDPQGDILVFMPREQDIREACDLLESRAGGDVLVLPLFARLSWGEQKRIFQSTSQRKIVVATNIAETSITIPGIRYVVDTGLARLLQYNPRTRTTSLPVKKVSRSSADQRKGRCGRVEGGVCIRLYDEGSYEERPLFTPPEISRANLAEVILRMLSLNLGKIHSFPFVDPPQPRSIKDGIDVLQELGAIAAKKKDEREGDDRPYALTDLGRRMARLPMDPRISRMILEAASLDCVEEVAVIASALSIPDPRERPLEKEDEADRMHTPFRDPSSDFLTLWNIWNTFHRQLESLKTQNRMRKFCKLHFLSYRRMREWRDVYDQIRGILSGDGSWKRRIGTGKPSPSQFPSPSPEERFAAIHKSILSGYLSNIAVKKEKNLYTATRGREVMLFPGSGLFGRGGAWIVAAEMVETSRLFARTVASIENAWLEELGGDLCRSSYADPRWVKDRGEVVATQQVQLFGLVIVPARTVSYGPVDPDEATRIFIREALVEGNVRHPLPFLTHNRELVEEASAVEQKLRRREYLADENDLAQFYEERLSGVYSWPLLKKKIRERGGDAFLRMSEADVFLRRPDLDELVAFPDHARIGRLRFPLDYRFDPAGRDDGVTLKIPVQALPALSPGRMEWAVPGLLRERISALLKGLPKEYRRRLQPVPQAVLIIMENIEESDTPLLTALSRIIHERFGVHVPVSAWSADAVSDHLKLRYLVVDEKGKTLAETRDIRALQAHAAADAESTAFDRMRREWERTGLTTWEVGTLPEELAVENVGLLFPALVPENEGISLRLLQNRAEARELHLQGVEALYALHFAEELRHLKKALVLAGDMKTRAEALGGFREVEKLLMDKVRHDLFAVPVRSQEDFLHHGNTVRSRILPRGQEVREAAGPIFLAAHETRKALRTLEQAHRSNSPAKSYLQSMEEEFHRLLPPDFLIRYDNERIRHILRYLKALAVRAERGLQHLEKALARSREIEAILARFKDLRNTLSVDASPEKKDALDDLYWMIEEYKVSLFAQELKTPYPVSPKRLDEKFREFERMA
ncbi:MAG: ATP-dependent RNA helicase HrpA [Deltaproteobacteria bacterium HGW-Deltaproteobacteria-19]|nr:MAG: ATP-dependent RNA helicase HrpA [Deltaproteobacteria bacterium HGW-Deltaproteobacteria-19]